MEKELVCLDCEEKLTEVNLEEKEVGDIIECEACGAEHELVDKEKVELKLIEEEK